MRERLVEPDLHGESVRNAAARSREQRSRIAGRRSRARQNCRNAAAWGPIRRSDRIPSDRRGATRCRRAGAQDCSNGVPGHSRSTSARFAASFFSRLCSSYGSGRNGSRRGSQRSVSMPLRMPCRSAARVASTPSNPKPYSFGLNLSRVGRAHGRDAVGKDDAALEQADLPPELERVHRHHLGAQLERRQPVGRKVALIREVVNRENSRHPAQARLVGVERAQVDRRQTGLPVVGVKDVERSPRTGGRTRARPCRETRNGAGCPGSRRPHRRATRGRTARGVRRARP